MKRVLTFGVAALVAASTLVAAETKDSKKASAPKIAAVINGEVITVDQLNAMYAKLNSQMQQSYADVGGKLTFLDNYIGKRLVVQQALKENFQKRPDIELAIEAAKESALFDLYIREVIATEVLPESDIRKYYDANPAEFQLKPLAKVRHIVATPQMQPVVNTSKTDAQSADEARRKLEGLLGQISAKNFSDLAHKFSEDMSAETGGDLGWVVPGVLEPNLDKAAFELKVGEVSKILETQYGYHLLLVEERKPAGIAPYEDVRKQIRERMLKDRSAQVLAALSAATRDLRESSQVTIYRENL